MSRWILKRGAREVPIPDDATFHRWAEEGRFNREDLIFHPVLQRWMYAQEVLEIRSAFEKQPSRDTGVTGSQEPKHALAAAGETTQLPSLFIVRQSGNEYRASDIETVRTWLREGRITSDAQVFNPSTNAWCQARELANQQAGPAHLDVNIAKLSYHYRQLVLLVGLQVLISLSAPLFRVFSVFIGPIILGTIIALAYYAYQTADALRSSAAPLWAAAMLVPCLNIITLLALSEKATKVCRAHGVPVGLLGPRV